MPEREDLRAVNPIKKGVNSCPKEKAPSPRGKGRGGEAASRRTPAGRLQKDQKI